MSGSGMDVWLPSPTLDLSFKFKPEDLYSAGRETSPKVVSPSSHKHPRSGAAAAAAAAVSGLSRVFSAGTRSLTSDRGGGDSAARVSTEEGSAFRKASTWPPASPPAVGVEAATIRLKAARSAQGRTAALHVDLHPDHTIQEQNKLLRSIAADSTSTSSSPQGAWSTRRTYPKGARSHRVTEPTCSPEKNQEEKGKEGAGKGISIPGSLRGNLRSGPTGALPAKGKQSQPLQNSSVYATAETISPPARAGSTAGRGVQKKPKQRAPSSPPPPLPLVSLTAAAAGESHSPALGAGGRSGSPRFRSYSVPRPTTASGIGLPPSSAKRDPTSVATTTITTTATITTPGNLTPKNSVTPPAPKQDAPAKKHRPAPLTLPATSLQEPPEARSARRAPTFRVVQDLHIIQPSPTVDETFDLDHTSFVAVQKVQMIRPSKKPVLVNVIDSATSTPYSVRPPPPPSRLPPRPPTPPATPKPMFRIGSFIPPPPPIPTEYHRPPQAGPPRSTWAAKNVRSPRLPPPPLRIGNQQNASLEVRLRCIDDEGVEGWPAG